MNKSIRSITVAAVRRVFPQNADQLAVRFGPAVFARIGERVSLVAHAGRVEVVVENQNTPNNAHGVDPRGFAERYLLPLPESEQQMLCEKISVAISSGMEPDLSAYRPFLAIREVLHRPLTPTGNTAGLHLAAHVEVFAQIDWQTVYLRGWLIHADGPAAHITLIAPDGQQMELVNNIYTYRRDDIEKAFAQPAFDGKQFGYGFIACVRFPRACAAGFSWQLYLRDSAGNECEHTLNPAIVDLGHIRQEILSDIRQRGLSDEDSLLAKHVHPALERLQQKHFRQLGIAMTRQFGEPASNPIASIVIPLYGRHDFLTYQMAKFADDPEMHQAELIYVLDSPDLSLALLQTAIEVFAIYRVPFKIIFLKTNAGYSLANNIGSTFATAPLLLLLNSDILPDAPGWLGKMVHFYSQTPGIGALGPKLLYEDETLQHAGMYFGIEQTEQTWVNKHYYKGLHRLLPAAGKSRPVPAVTGAALMINRELYNELGGLSGAFVHGDFEDSDLCLRLSQRGLTHWYLADVELFHLEGQSYPSHIRQNASTYNRWLHTQIWGPVISSLMQKSAFAEPIEELV